jgi:hypothetical protein
MLSIKFRIIWTNGFRIQELPVVAMFVNGSGRNEQFLQKTFNRYFLPNFSSFGKAVLEENTL